MLSKQHLSFQLYKLIDWIRKNGHDIITNLSVKFIFYCIYHRTQNKRSTNLYHANLLTAYLIKRKELDLQANPALYEY